MSTYELITHLADNMAVIGSLGAGQKITVRPGTFGTDIAVDNGFIQGIGRRYRGDSRDVTIGAIKKIIRWAIELHSTFCLICKKITGVASSYNRNFEALELALGRVSSGLHNLMITYVADQAMVADLTALVSDVESRMTL